LLRVPCVPDDCASLCFGVDPGGTTTRSIVQALRLCPSWRDGIQKHSLGGDLALFAVHSGIGSRLARAQPSGVQHEVWSSGMSGATWKRLPYGGWQSEARRNLERFEGVQRFKQCQGLSEGTSLPLPDGVPRSVQAADPGDRVTCTQPIDRLWRLRSLDSQYALVHRYGLDVSQDCAGWESVCWLGRLGLLHAELR
jgi:hypothetical protein